MLKQTEVNCYYLGKTYPLFTRVDSSINKVSINFDGESFICVSPNSGSIDISEDFKKFYIKECKKLISERLKLYQPNIKVKYKSFSIENEKNKWGSCNSSKHLTFNWKLILFPIEAIDYVVVHELCHLMHMNHDRSFWRLVGKIQPQYKEAMAILGSTKTRDL